jgi:hypothetical protein
MIHGDARCAEKKHRRNLRRIHEESVRMTGRGLQLLLGQGISPPSPGWSPRGHTGLRNAADASSKRSGSSHAAAALCFRAGRIRRGGGGEPRGPSGGSAQTSYWGWPDHNPAARRPLVGDGPAAALGCFGSGASRRGGGWGRAAPGAQRRRRSLGDLAAAGALAGGGVMMNWAGGGDPGRRRRA